MPTNHVRRAYSFVCLDCGHGWEGAYDIDVTVDEHARITADYQLDGERVPSPLQSPQCPSCEGTRYASCGRGVWLRPICTRRDRRGGGLPWDPARRGTPCRAVALRVC